MTCLCGSMMGLGLLIGMALGAMAITGSSGRL